ncbi:hypothetical protein [Neodiprion abietis nucleopolyhedrovirus]|uniref:Uncharacterized protein n=1 Tax=Neodiprion abietis nucleopolyhedrovirus TaxID=204507 RepID=Q0ZP67_9CBAC|nr:hypothetical protein [Neodiprion abietis nucleopolyhedrovirus]ABC74887.1 unknown [Neodiprion abietis nucleopolyhedrovirus]
MTDYYGVIVNKYTFRNLVQKITELTEENVRLRENSGDYLKAQRIINIALNQQHIDVNSNLTDLVTKLITSKNIDYRNCQKCDVRAISDNVAIENTKQISDCKTLLSSLQTETLNVTANLNKYTEIMDNFHSRIIRLINDKIPALNMTDDGLLRDNFIRDLINDIVILFDEHLVYVSRINVSTDTNFMIQKHSSFITNLRDMIKRIYANVSDTKRCDQLLQVFLGYLTGYEKFRNLNKNKFLMMSDVVMRDLAFEIQRLCSEDHDSITMDDDFYGNDQYSLNDTLFQVITGNREIDIVQATLDFRTLNQSLQQRLLNSSSTNTYDLIKEFIFVYDTTFSDYKKLQIENSDNSELKSLLRLQTNDANSCTSTIKETYEMLKNINDIIDDETVPILSFTNTNTSTMTLNYDENNVTTLISVTQFVQNKLSVFRDKFNKYFNVSESFNLNTSLNIIKTTRTDYYSILTQKLIKIPDKNIDVIHELVIRNINETKAILQKNNISDNYLLQMIQKYVDDTKKTIQEYEDNYDKILHQTQTLQTKLNDVKNKHDVELEKTLKNKQEEITKLESNIKEYEQELEKYSQELTEAKKIIEDQMEREFKHAAAAQQLVNNGIKSSILETKAHNDIKSSILEAETRVPDEYLTSSVKIEPRVPDENKTPAIKIEPRVPIKRPNVFMSDDEKPHTIAKRPIKMTETL